MLLILDLVFLHSNSLELLCKISSLSNELRNRYCSVSIDGTNILLGLVSYDEVYVQGELPNYYYIRYYLNVILNVRTTLLNMRLSTSTLCKTCGKQGNYVDTDGEINIYISTNKFTLFMSHIIESNNMINYIDKFA